MDKYFQTEKGFTLLEVLLSIVLLSIILTSFMGFFTQSAIFTKKNEVKISTSQTAQRVINVIEDRVTEDILASNTATAALPTNVKTTVTIDKNKLEELVYPEVFPTSYTITSTITNDTPEQLIRFKVTVSDPVHPENQSETYTYLRR